MRNLKMALVLSVLGSFFLISCTTLPAEEPLKDKDIIYSLLLALIQDKETSEQIIYLLDTSLNRTKIKDYDIAALLARHYRNAKKPNKTFEYDLKKAHYPDSHGGDYLKIACHYWAGTGTPIDKEQAITWLEKAALRGNISARFFLSEIYNRGLYASKDIEKGTYWEIRAFASTQRSRRNNKFPNEDSIKFHIHKQLDRFACNPTLENIAQKYRNEVIQNERKTANELYLKYRTMISSRDSKQEDLLHLLEASALLGHPRAILKLAKHFNHKNHASYSPVKAIAWYKKSVSLSPHRFSRAKKLADLLWMKNKHSEAVFWYAYAADRYPNQKDIENYSRYLNYLNAEERREFNLMYENWAYRAKLP